MPDRVEVFAVLVAPGTVKGSSITDISLSRPSVVVGLEIIIPDGVNGQAGFALLNAHTQVIPFVKGTYVTGNNEKIPWDLSGFIESGSWQIDPYNSGDYDHTFYLRFLVNEIALPGANVFTPSTPPLISPSNLGGV